MDWGTLYFSPGGRISRSTLWLKYVVPATVIAIVLTLVDMALPIGPEIGDEGQRIGVLSLIWSLVNIWIGLCIQIKRWHDLDKSGWWVLIVLVPLIGAIWAFISVGCLKGTAGPNRFGPDPLAG